MFYVHLSILFGSFATSIIFGTASLRTFASNQILTATNNFDPTCFIAFEGIPTWWYRGIIENRTYMRYLADKGIEPKVVEAYNDFLLSARMSNHVNFLKLLGCFMKWLIRVIKIWRKTWQVVNDLTWKHVLHLISDAVRRYIGEYIPKMIDVAQEFRWIQTSR